ncbi:unnamed protein product [Chondrus crispus]|uniref:Uncharacterized protein n=1 Tax=Chondrus crispus TaxID=2769 RepID=R7QHU6_CHOCR|nr:unnamed protein product [Chondrus crispus]CDF37348.1 unnamed protein product [Chondrus crispus]|eukprot:XP_005717167.1 unnamed protein product [Chondrus crispus]
MSTAQLFTPSENALLDSPFPTPLPPQPTLTAPYVDTYLAFRTRPLFRPIPTHPFAPLDLQVSSHLPPTPSPAQLLDIAVLFPPSVTAPIVAPHLSDLAKPVSRMVNSLTRALATADVVHVLDCFDVLLALALADARSIVLEALSSRRDRGAAVKKVGEWAAIARRMNSPQADARLANGLRARDMLAGLAALLVDALLGLPPPESGKHVALKLEEDRKEGDLIGKAANRRKKTGIKELDTFSGEKDLSVDADWYKRRVAAQQAREHLEQERLEEQDRAIQDGGFNLPEEDTYNDDPDEGELAGEAAMKDLLNKTHVSDSDDSDGMPDVPDAAFGGTSQSGRGYGRGRGRGSGRGRGRGRGRGGGPSGDSLRGGGRARGHGRNGVPPGFPGRGRDAGGSTPASASTAGNGSLAFVTEAESVAARQPAVERSTSASGGRGRGRGRGRGSSETQSHYGRRDWNPAGRQSVRNQRKSTSTASTGSRGGGSPRRGGGNSPRN